MQFCLFFIFSLFAISASFANDGQSIAEKIQNAKPGDTIIISTGVYKEYNLLINKPLTIKAEPHTIIDAEEKGEIFLIVSDDVTIEGFELVRSGRSTVHDIASIKASNIKNCKIINNTIRESFFAVYLGETEGCQVIGNQILGPHWDESQSGDGLHLWKSSEFLLQNNVVSGHRDGIYLEFSKRGKIENNKSFENYRYGLHFMFSSENHFTKNHFTKNGAGVAVMYSEKIDMDSNEYSQSWGAASYGLLLKDINRSHIHNNHFTKNTTAIYMEGSNQTQIYHNEFSDNGLAIRIYSSCDENKIYDNNFMRNTFDITTNSFSSNNTFSSNYWDQHKNIDLNADGTSDLPFRPIRLSGIMMEQYSLSILLVKGALFEILDFAEKAFPNITPPTLEDATPRVAPVNVEAVP